MEIYVIGYTSIFSLSFCLYIEPYHSPSTHNQHQHICLRIGGEPQHSSTMNYTLSQSKQSKPKAFPKKIKTFIPTLYSNHHSLQREEVCVKVTNTSLYTNPKETSQEPSKSYPSHNLSQGNKITCFPMRFHI